MHFAFSRLQLEGSLQILLSSGQIFFGRMFFSLVTSGQYYWKGVWRFYSFRDNILGRELAVYSFRDSILGRELADSSLFGTVFLEGSLQSTLFGTVFSEGSLQILLSLGQYFWKGACSLLFSGQYSGKGVCRFFSLWDSIFGRMSAVYSFRGKPLLSSYKTTLKQKVKRWKMRCRILMCFSLSCSGA